MTDLQKLEEHVAHLTKTVDELSDLVAVQDSEIRRMRGMVDILIEREKARESEGGGGFVLGDEKPPHY